MNTTKWLSRAVGCTLLAAAGLSHGQSSFEDDEERTELRKAHTSKDFKLIGYSVGDCHMSGVLTIFDNGYAIWTASSKTDHTTFGDVWHETLEVQDAEGHRLFGFGEWNSPTMLVGSEYNWKNTATFPAGLFVNAASVSSSASC